MHIDPHGWIVALPIVAGMLWVYYQPADHSLKQLWRELARMEAMGLSVISPIDCQRDAEESPPLHHVLFWSALSAFSIAGVMSFATFAGLF